ncbi:MAG: hypothetical protein H6737_27365 [Alphaproteobacteria bacterium]|nr:hypothetical protein [Alphaproteobacteria bacterium]
MLLWLASAWAATLAVLPFDNHTGDADQDALGVGLADMLVTDLGQVGSLELVERARLNDVLAELALARSDFADPAKVAKAGKGVGAEWMLVGAISAVSPEMRLDARVVDVATGRVLKTASAKGPIGSFFDVEKDLAFAVAEALGVTVAPREAAKVGRVATESFEAFRAWSEGLDALDHGEIDAATRRFETALSHDSGFAGASSALEGLRGTLEQADARRRELLDASQAEIDALLAGFESGRGRKEDIGPFVNAVAMRMSQRPPEESFSICKRLVDMGLDASVEVARGRPVAEWALGCMVSEAVRLRDRAQVLALGEAYVKRYPSGPWYPIVRMQVDTALQSAEAERAARASGQLDALRKQWEYRRYDEACSEEPDERRVPKVCRAWLDWMKAHNALDERGVKDVLHHAKYAGDLALMKDVVKAAEKLDVPAETRLGWNRSVEGMQKQVARIPAHREYLERKLAEGSRLYTNDLDDFREVGLFDEGLAWVARARKTDMPKRDADYEEWHILDALFDVAAMKRMHASVRDEERPFMSPSERERWIHDVEKARLEADQAEAYALDGLCRDLEQAGLFREAAETWDRLATGFPDYYDKDPVTLPMQAGYKWQGVYEPDSRARAKAWFERVIERFPDTVEAQRARDSIRLLGYFD